MANQSLQRLLRRLAKIPLAVRQAASDQALIEAHGLAKAQQYAAPQDDGALKESVRVESGRRGSLWLVRAGGEKTTRPVREGASATYDYALGQEFGNANNPAQPFFYPPYRHRRAKIRKAIGATALKAAQDTLDHG